MSKQAAKTGDQKATSVEQQSALGSSRSAQFAALTPAQQILRLQAKAGNHAVHGSLCGGKPLPDEVRVEMESRFGIDFSEVRIHDDTQAHSSASLYEAKAFTHGKDIVFGTNRFAPKTGEGRHLLAHELSHVIQQRRGGAAPNGDANTPSENAARQAANEITSGHSQVTVSGATSVGIAREETEKKANRPKRRKKEKGQKPGARIGTLLTREDKIKRSERDVDITKMERGENLGMQTTKWKGGRDDRQGALRRLSQEPDPLWIPEAARLDLQAQVKKAMSSGHYDETKHFLTTPDGYHLAHFEKGTLATKEGKLTELGRLFLRTFGFLPDDPYQGAPARDGYSYNYARMITAEEHRAETYGPAKKKNKEKKDKPKKASKAEKNLMVGPQKNRPKQVPAVPKSVVRPTTKAPQLTPKAKVTPAETDAPSINVASKSTTIPAKSPGKIKPFKSTIPSSSPSSVGSKNKPDKPASAGLEKASVKGQQKTVPVFGEVVIPEAMPEAQPAKPTAVPPKVRTKAPAKAPQVAPIKPTPVPPKAPPASEKTPKTAAQPTKPTAASPQVKAEAPGKIKPLKSTNTIAEPPSTSVLPAVSTKPPPTATTTEKSAQEAMTGGAGPATKSASPPPPKKTTEPVGAKQNTDVDRGGAALGVLELLQQGQVISESQDQYQEAMRDSAIRTLQWWATKGVYPQAQTVVHHWLGYDEHLPVSANELTSAGAFDGLEVKELTDQVQYDAFEKWARGNLHNYDDFVRYFLQDQDAGVQRNGSSWEVRAWRWGGVGSAVLRGGRTYSEWIEDTRIASFMEPLYWSLIKQTERELGELGENRRHLPQGQVVGKRWFQGDRVIYSPTQETVPMIYGFHMDFTPVFYVLEGKGVPPGYSLVVGADVFTHAAIRNSQIWVDDATPSISSGPHSSGGLRPNVDGVALVRTESLTDVQPSELK